MAMAKEPSSIELETIEVTSEDPTFQAEKAEVNLTAGGVTLVNMDDVRERNVSSLADMFRYVPGVFATSDSGTDGIFFTSRGSNLDATDYDMNGIKLLQDGMPVTTADGNNHNRIIDPLSAQYATVARGANGMKYGASTLGGAVNFITPTAFNSPTMSLYLNGGTFDQFLGRGTVSKVFNESFDALVTVEGKHWAGYRDHNNQNRMGVYANAGWKINDAVDTRVFMTYVNNEQELAGSLTRDEYDSNPEKASAKAIGGNFQLDVETWRIANKTTWQIDEDSSLEVGFSYEEQTLFHPIVDKVIIPIRGVPTEVFSLLIDTEHQDFGASARYKQRIDDHNLLVGFNFGLNAVKGGHYRNDSGRHNGLSKLIDNDATTIEAFVLDRWNLTEKLTLNYGLQVVAANRDVHESTVRTGAVNNPSADYFGFNPTAGLIYNVTKDASVYGNVSRLYEPPTSFELGDNVAGGNEALDAMEGTVIEIGTRGTQNFGNASNVSWDLSLYHAWLKNEILSVEDPVRTGESLSTNADDTIHAGIEATISANLAIDDNGTHSIAPTLSFTINEFKFDGDVNYGDNALPAAPDYFVRGETLYRHASGFYIGPTFDIVGERYADFANTYRVDSYVLIGARAGWENENIRVFIEGKNLADENYVANHGVRDTASADADILNPGSPISVYGGVEISF
ncbi:MAG: TonB-dependent receptor plug domain-containing protein [Methylococcaceae bacterium]|nr:TonB-dependent receptor plug domain-containing protein [Methylococcaceae bacterium]